MIVTGELLWMNEYSTKPGVAGSPPQQGMQEQGGKRVLKHRYLEKEYAIMQGSWSQQSLPSAQSISQAP